MAQWKKIIVSGSDAELRTLTSSVSIGVGTNQIISTNPTLTKLSGSFSGSFYGDGSQLTGVTATGLNIDLFGSDLTAITVQPTDLMILSDNGTEGRVRVSQLANPLTGIGLSEVTGKITLDTGSTHFTSGVKQKLNTDTVVSSSAQVVLLLPTGTVSGSSQVVGVLSSLNAYTSSNDTINTTQNSRLDQLSTASGSAIGRLTNIESFTSSINTTIKGQLNSNTVVSGSSQIDATQTTNFATGVKTQLNANTVVSGSSQIQFLSISGRPTGLVSGSSQIDVKQTQNYSTLATTGSNIFVGNQVITGSMYITSDLIVQGSSSLQFITASAVELGTNTIILNTDIPAIRFAGISVIDSGSGQGGSGSLWWDSLRNHWVYEHPADSESDYNSSILIAGPKNYGSLGNETGLTSGSIPVATGTDHIDNSVITQVTTGGNSTITVAGDVNIIGTLSATQIEGIGGNIVSASQDSSTVDFSITSGVITANLIGGVVSGSSQVVGILSSLNSYTASNDTTNTTQNSRLTQLETFSGSVNTKFSTLATYTGSVDTKFSTLATYTGSNDTLNTTQNSRLDQLSTASGSAIGRLTNIESFSGSVNTKFSTLATYTGSNDALNTTQNSRLDQLSTASGSAIGRLNNIESFTSSINTTIKGQLNSNTVISGSSQVQLASITGTTFANNEYKFPNNLIVDGNFTVNGTTTVISTTNLLVEDRFILLNSGSQNPDEGGLVIDEGSGKGHAFVYDSDSSRWGFTASLASDATSVTPDAFAAAVVTTDIVEYQKVGNIRVDGNGDIFIYA